MQETSVSLIADTIVTDDGPNLCQQLTSDELDEYLEDAMDLKKTIGAKKAPRACEQLTGDELNASLGDAMDMKEDVEIPLGLSVISKRETRQETAIL
ncbi:hypothetical protein ACHAPV_009158 [Trichoderma viride]